MLKQKKNFVLLSLIFLFSACGSLPEKPQVEICGHDLPNAVIECFDNQTNEFRTLEYSDTDEYILFSPDDWGLILIHIDKLSRYTRNKTIKEELNKIIKTSSKLNQRFIKENIYKSIY